MIEILKKKSKYSRISIKVCENATPGTWGSHQLLLDQYKEEDCSWIGTPSNPNPAYLQMKFNTEWLESILAKYGELHCEYCGKSELKIYQWWEKPNKSILATTDHFFPKKDFPHLAKEPGNFVVCCDSCNSKKRERVVNKSAIKFPYPEKRIF